MNTFLVTGGAGFIGSHLCDTLLSKNLKVICLDSFDDYYDPRIKRNNIESALTNQNFTLFEGDIRDKKLLENIFSKFKIDLVFHLAARAGVRPSIQYPELYFDVNVNGTITLLEAMRKFNISNLIFASSSSVYGNSDKIPFSEEDIIDKPISPYAASKRACELICYTYHFLYSFNIFCLRFFTVFGPRQRPEMAISKFVNAIRHNEIVELYGDGTTSRDYTFVKDIINGICRVLNHLNGFEIFNLGSGRAITLIEMVETIQEVLNKKAIIKWKEFQPGDVKKTIANIEKAKKYLNYYPAFSFKEGIKEFVDWSIKNNS